MKHKCYESIVCTCYILGLDPDEQCPLHGYSYPPRCVECGRFIKTVEMKYDPRDLAILGGDPSL